VNVLFLSDARFTHAPYRDGATRYRCYHVAEAMQQAGHLTDVSTLDAFDLKCVSRYDVISVRNPRASKKLTALLERCDAQNISTVADLDELAFDPAFADKTPMAMDHTNSLDDIRSAFMRQAMALKQFDALTVATEELARQRRVKDPSQPVHVVRNGLSEFWLSRNAHIKSTKPGNLRMNYLSGMRSPQSNFTIAAEALKKFMRSHNDAELLVVGALQMEKIGLPESRLIRAAWIDFMDLPALLQNTWISVDPLVNNEYNRAKPHTRFIESAAFGVPLISTPTVDLEQHDVPGLFLVNDEREWLDAFNALSDLDYYAQCSQALREYARDCCMAGNYVNDLVANWYNPFEEFKIDELTAPISEAC